MQVSPEKSVVFFTIVCFLHVLKLFQSCLHFFYSLFFYVQRNTDSIVHSVALFSVTNQFSFVFFKKKILSF